MDIFMAENNVEKYSFRMVISESFLDFMNRKDWYTLKDKDIHINYRRETQGMNKHLDIYFTNAMSLSRSPIIM